MKNIFKVVYQIYFFIDNDVHVWIDLFCSLYKIAYTKK
jgi:hypothetical protein